MDLTLTHPHRIFDHTIYHSIVDSWFRWFVFLSQESSNCEKISSRDVSRIRKAPKTIDIFWLFSSVGSSS